MIIGFPGEVKQTRGGNLSGERFPPHPLPKTFGYPLAGDPVEEISHEGVSRQGINS